MTQKIQLTWTHRFILRRLASGDTLRMRLEDAARFTSDMIPVSLRDYEPLRDMGLLQENYSSIEITDAGRRAVEEHEVNNAG